jgi:predicted transcriptional regulator
MAASSERKSKILSISVSPEMFSAIETMAEAESRTKSELTREAFRQYQFVRRWRLIRLWGKETAARLGIDSDEALERFLG